MDKWDNDERKKERKMIRQENIGRFMVIGASFFLFTYIFTIMIESYAYKCGTC
ncbi:MAG: hypothetical protein IIA82_08345 [Thaumarchaeota archaeon]|nr:hypothetical protein [Nitrososphaerota archaeon]